MKTLIRLLATYIALVTTVLAAPINADTIFVVNYQATNADLQDVAGAFSGKDTNADGWLTRVEVTDWHTTYGDGATYAALNDIGDFDIFNRVWMPNALQWNQTTRDAYMTWDEWTKSASTRNVSWNWAFDVKYVQGTAAPIPEPETYAMMLAGLGVLGVMARRRKQVQH